MSNGTRSMAAFTASDGIHDTDVTADSMRMGNLHRLSALHATGAATRGQWGGLASVRGAGTTAHRHEGFLAGARPGGPNGRRGGAADHRLPRRRQPHRARGGAGPA